ncbi:hypothetical protein INT47_003323 [Mucor saturninus]|uniref:Ras GEF n=1 Tax=Mucor saturninus TaxID=64648 RepID=A0A8H7VBE7_9FUNG|nr:hypothetical protein INT47_003323 [Mucor saturninus]
MNRIHSPTPDNESINSSHLETSNSKRTRIMPLQDENPNPTPRKRNNSLIPIELMMNNSGEGGRECAALATVFGVPEYIDSKIFWERQQYQHEGLLPKKQANNTRPTNGSTMTNNTEKYGHISVNGTSVMSRPLSTATHNNEGDTIMLQDHEYQSKFVISSYVDSVLDPVGSSELLKPSFPAGNATSPTPTATKSFSLPHIPTVSKFQDILYQDENGFDVMFPANPSSILIHSSTPIIRSESLSSINSSFILSSQSAKHISSNQDEESIHPTTRLVVTIGSPETFDLIISDDDERFIIWGPDPIVLSSSMATTTTPESPSSYATLYNNQQNKRPELKGFSSNATSTLARSKSIHSVKNNSSTRSSFASVRLSAQLWSESLKLGNKHALNNEKPAITKHGSLLLRKAFGIKTKAKRDSISSEINTNAFPDIPKVIEAATIHKLVEKLTNTLDYTFMTDFFLTYRDFLYPEDLCQLLISRFYWALKNDEEPRRIVRIRTFVVLRHWLNNYFVHDFIGNRPLRRILTDFLNKLPRHPLVKESPRDQRIVKILKRVVRRLKKLYYNRSSGASRVKVIAPPPPTAEQEQMGEIVRAKLSQNAIRRKTALGVDMSSHHNGNMAVQDARYAPVVVVGSLNMKGSFIDSGLDNNKSSFVQLRRYPSQHSVPAQTSHDIDNTVVTGLEDNQTIRSSIHHRYDKSVHEASDFNGEGGTNIGAGVNEASSVISVASDDSLESELSAGETVPEESEDDDDDHSHIQQESCVEYDEHERHWMQEQQETLEYFKSLSINKPISENPGMSQSSSLTQLDTSYNHLMIGNVLNNSPTQLAPAASPIRPKIPPEFIQTDKADLTSEYSSPSTPTTPTHATAKKDSNAQKGIRRIPSERWCKTDDYQNKHPLDIDHGKTLPDELLKELSGDETQHKSPIGLSRKLSKKSIERRKSERSFQDPSWSSAPSSATTSPYLTGTVSDHDIPDVPELPPLTSDMLGGSYKSRSKAVKKKSLLPKKKSMHPDDLLIDTSGALEAFASIPYESTKVSTKAQEEVKEDTQANKVPKRRLSRVISKVFRPNQEEKPSKESDIPKTPTTIEQKPELPLPAEVETKQEEKQGGGHLVSLIAQRLRLNSVDDSETEELACDCAKCSGNKENTATCRRLSVMLMPDDERRRSFELRRRRGASVDMSQQDFVNHLGAIAQEQKNGKDLKSGPVYLGHLQARSVIGSNALPEDTDSVHESSDDDNSTASFAPSERSIQTEAQASSSRARMSFISDAASQVPRSKLIELGIPPVLPTHQHIPDTNLQNNNEATASIPRPIHNVSPKPSGRCFIMSYRTSMIASQLCFIERDVLVKVGWEELIHCKWTKMDASGKINPNYANESTFEDDIDDEKINYTRQSEMRRTEEQGIEQVIQRFNTVCQWVSSEIVRTRNINERVRLIEKFIRLAKKCKMYSNYATLVQILLGLQSPAVARLERTWSKVSAKCQKLLSKLTEFTSPMKNWKNIRDSMTEVAEEYGNSPAEVQVEMPGTTANRQKFKKTTRIKIPFGGCIPFLGIYLSDLVFNSEKPRFLKANLESQKIYSANNTRNMPACLDQPLVNFRKHRVIATVIKRVLTFQNLSTRYSFDADGILLDKCRNLEVLDAAKIRELSAMLE